ncbi:MAG: elongation factor G [Acidiferrobacterales bacterium]|nr:elongation factor G [Acidiferrobacterales bacterium]
MPYTTDDIRNVALLGQAGSGKTLLSEALLHAANVIPSAGEIARKNTVSDCDALEKEHQRSLVSSVMSFDCKDRRVNLIDTPGYSDFMGSALSSLSAVETAVIVVNAQNGIETMTRRTVDLTRELGICTAIAVNKIDLPDQDLESIYSSLQDEFGSECLAVNLPSDSGASVVGCLFKSDGSPDFSSIDDAHIAIADQIVEVDEDLMEQYLEDGELPDNLIAPVFKQAMREGHLIPVIFTSAQTGAGIGELLDLIDGLLPNPNEGKTAELTISDDATETVRELKPDSGEDVVAHAFKIAFDPFVGKVGNIRVFEGTLKKDASLFIGDARKPVRISNLFSMLGKVHTDVSEAVAGDIVGLAKIDEIEHDSVLLASSSDSPVSLRTAKLPTPMVGLAISSANRGDEQKVAEALQKIAAEDPCINLERNPAANETVLRGLGDLHLRIALERLDTIYNVSVTTSVPTIPYKETVSKISEGHCRHKKQTGGAGQFGEVFLRVEPMPRGKGFEFVDNVVGGVIPSQFIPAVEKGVKQVLENGAIAGFPLQDIRVVVHDGKYHSVDSKEVAFVTAGKKAFIDAVSKASPIVLEPIADVSITAPSSNMGDIAGELSSRRGRISDTDSLANSAVRITGSAPLAEMSDFQSRLNAITGGEGAFVLEFGTYEPAPMEIQKRLQAQFIQPDED